MAEPRWTVEWETTGHRQSRGLWLRGFDRSGCWVRLWYPPEGMRIRRAWFILREGQEQWRELGRPLHDN